MNLVYQVPTSAQQWCASSRYAPHPLYHRILQGGSQRGAVPNFQPNEPMKQKPINDGGPAYPVPADQYVNDGVSMQAIQAYPGMSLRDYFAGQAVSSIIAASIETHQGISRVAKNLGVSTDELTAESAYSLADAMLAEREKGGDK